MTDHTTTRRVHIENQGLSSSQLTRPSCLPLNPMECAFFSSKNKHTSSEVDNVYSQGVEVLQNAALMQMKSAGPDQTVDAALRLIKALEPFESGILRLGQILVVKVTRQQQSYLHVETIAPELARELERYPKFLQNPEALFEFFETRGQEATAAWNPNEMPTLARFITPYARQVEALLSTVRGAMGTGVGPARHDKLAAALYQHLTTHKIIYDYEPLSLGVPRRIRYPGQILGNGGGNGATCLDLSLLWASCIEAAHGEPLVFQFVDRRRAACCPCHRRRLGAAAEHPQGHI
jgi:hypothetical protein